MNTHACLFTDFDHHHIIFQYTCIKILLVKKNEDQRARSDLMNVVSNKPTRELTLTCAGMSYSIFPFWSDGCQHMKKDQLVVRV